MNQSQVPSGAVGEGAAVGLGAGPAPGGFAIGASSPGPQNAVTESRTSFGVNAQGVTPTTIKLGVYLPGQASAVLSAYGARGASVGDARLEAQAMANYLNARGGVAGRKLGLFFYEYNIFNQDQASETQAACTYWTQDSKVFSVMFPHGVSPGMIACLRAANTPLVGGASALMADKQFQDRYERYFYSPSNPHIGRWVDELADALVAEKFFTASTKIGVIRVDGPEWAQASKIFRARLAAHGLKVSDEQNLTSPEQTNGTILRFRGEGLDRVAILESGGATTLLFIEAAAASNYYPRYALTSANYVSNVEPNVPSRALEGAMGVGWSPVRDVNPSQNHFTNPTKKLCLKIMADAGETYSDPLAEVTALGYCDDFLAFARGAVGATILNPATLGTGFDSLGASYESPLTFATRFAPGRHDAPLKVQTSVFDGGCTCMRYTGRFYELP